MSGILDYGKLVGYFLQKYGLSKTIKAVYYYICKSVRMKNIDFNKNIKLQINGYEMSVIPGDKGISAGLILFKTHEPVTTQLVKNQLREGMVCLDIGGNIGYYACLESNCVGKSGKVIAIEPSPDNISYLRKNLELQKFSNYEVHNFACGNEDGFIDFAVSDKSNYSRTIEKNDEIQLEYKDNIRIVKVPVKKIDSFLSEKNLDRLDFARMDVEGFEFHVYHGMQKTIKKYVPMLQIEFHPKVMGITKTVQLLEDMKNDGYEAFQYLSKDLDVPIVGDFDDLENISIDEIIRMTKNDNLPLNFQLLLKNKQT